MRPGRLLRIGGWAGLGFLVLDVVGQTLAIPADGKANDPIASVAAYYTAHRHQLIAGVLILAIAALCLTWFLGALYQHLRATGERDDPVPAIILISGAVVTVLFLVDRVPQVVLALMAGQPGGLDSGLTVRALADLQGVLTTAMFVSTAVLVPAISIGLVRRGAARAWLAWVGGITAALFLASGLAGTPRWTTTAGASPCTWATSV